MSSSSRTSWVRIAACTVLPRLTRPAAGCSSPRSSRSSVVLPEPLTPTTPIRSPGPIRQVTSDRSTRSVVPGADGEGDVLEVEDVLAEPGGGHLLQGDAVAGRRLVGDQGVRGVDPEPGLAGPGGGATAQPGELLAEQVLAPLLGDGGGRGPARPGPARTRRSRRRRRRRRRRGPPRSASQTASRNQRSWVTTTSPPRSAGQRARRCRASQSTPSTSRWLVGSSSRRTSCVPGEQRGQRDPPPLPAGQPSDSRVEAADPGGVQAAEQPGDDVADPRRRRPNVVGTVADDRVPDVERRRARRPGRAARRGRRRRG